MPAAPPAYIDPDRIRDGPLDDSLGSYEALLLAIAEAQDRVACLVAAQKRARPEIAQKLKDEVGHGYYRRGAVRYRAYRDLAGFEREKDPAGGKP